MDAPLRDKTSAEPGAHARPLPAQVLRPRQRGEQEAGAQRAERRIWRGRTAALRPEGARLQGELAARHAPGAGTRLRGVVPREVGVKGGARGGEGRGQSLEKWGEVGTDRRGSGTEPACPAQPSGYRCAPSHRRLALSRGVGGACQPGLTCAKGSGHLSLMAVSGNSVWPGLLRRRGGGRVKGTDQQTLQGPPQVQWIPALVTASPIPAKTGFVLGCGLFGQCGPRAEGPEGPQSPAWPHWND